MMIRPPYVCCLLLLAAFLFPTASQSATIDFTNTVRPILADRCFQCHGPDESQRESDLRLDTQAGAFADLGDRRTIVPGVAGESELVRRIMSDDPDEMMPPPDSGKTLNEAEKGLLKAWINEGAEWKRHWSFVPPKRTTLPEPPRDASFEHHTGAIDRFLAARLSEHNLTATGRADRNTLIRRVTLDLTGLPPRPAEVAAFLNDTSTDAYEKIVDRLLDSPHYGEHMARFWLDVSRFADTHGLHLDNYREMWLYRDWVIRAFNRNQPFDQFLTEQLAGDLLPEPEQDQLVATGFNRCHVTTGEGGSIKQEVYVRNVVDRVETFGTVFMGLTIGCAVCHDHKYDPLTQRDFYQLFAFFNSLDGPAMDANRKDPAPVTRVLSASNERQMAELVAQREALEAEREEVISASGEAQRQWERGISEASEPPVTLSPWHSLGPFSAESFEQAGEHDFGVETRTAENWQDPVGDIAWQARPAWNDGQVQALDLPTNSALYLARTITTDQVERVELAFGSDDSLRVWLNGKRIVAHGTPRAVAADQNRVETDLAPGQHLLLVKIGQASGDAGFYFSLQRAVLPEDLLEITQLPRSQRTEEQSAALEDYFIRNVHLPAKQLQQQVDDLTNQEQQLRKRAPTTLIWRELAEPRPAFILQRGQYDQPGAAVARQTPAALPAWNEDWPRDRLGLARWLLDAEHPLTGRVAVNRFWQQVFGIGLVRTAEDFGNQGEPPSHPDLLDWLSVDFRESGWDVKRLMKMMVMSAAYQQSTRVSPAQRLADPENRLLGRGPRFRLDAEMLRDQSLMISGLLVNRVGGPSVKPPQPDGLWFAVGYSGSNTVRFKKDAGPEKVYRRSLYTFWKRTAPPPQMSTFDAPSREVCTVRRERTNTPLQALLLMNDPQYVEAARVFAERILREGGSTDDSRLRFAYAWAVARPPAAEELALLKATLNQHRETFLAAPAAAERLVRIGETPAASGMATEELAAWTLVTNLLLNLDEVITKG